MVLENSSNPFTAQNSLLPEDLQQRYANGLDVALDRSTGTFRSTSSLEIQNLSSSNSVQGSSTAFTSGFFTVGSTGQVVVDYLFDGGGYSQGELAMFSLQGLEALGLGTPELFQEAARRALSNSTLGHVVISDRTAGARFSGSLPWEDDFNSGDYLGGQTFAMNPGDRFGFMLVPNGTIQQVFDYPNAPGELRPLFSLGSANPNSAFQFGQIADVDGKGHTFTFEDLRLDGESDRDYNEFVIQVRGAIGSAVSLDQVIDPAKDWRRGPIGQALLSYAAAYDHPPTTQTTDYRFPKANQPLIGIIDTGFAANNPDIDYSRIILGRDYVDGDANPLLAPGEGNEHGTHILGIIGATQNNGIGIDGLNDQAPIWVGRAIGSGRWADSLVDFVNQALESNQPHAVINLSLDLTQRNSDGSITTRYEFTPQERAALEYARQNGVVIVAAAGNDGGVMSALGQASQEFDNIITVGAADGLNRADYSSYGYGLDILAPGGTTDNGILSTVADGMGTLAGTSVATAHVSGAIAQVWAANPSLSYRQVIEILKITARDVGSPDWNAETGAGLVNVTAAVSLAQATESNLGHQFIFENLPNDEMSVNLKSVFENILSGFEDVSELNDDDLNNLTVEERQAYEEIVQDISSELNNYLAKAGQKLALEYQEAKFGLELQAIENLLEVLTENNLEDLILAQSILQDQGFSADIDLEALALASNFNQIRTNDDFIPSERPVSYSVPAFNGQVLSVGYVSQVSFLRIRSGPGTNYAEVGRRYPGNTITFDAVEDNGTWVPDPYMPGGGSSRWYKIAGTNQWMSALYFNNTPELAAQERANQEAIQRAAEASRRDEEAAQRAAEAAQRVAEEAQRQLEEALRRNQEEALRRIAEQDAAYRVAQSSPAHTPNKHIEYEVLAKRLVYNDYKEGDLVQPAQSDREQGYRVDKVFKGGDGLYALGLVKDGQPPVLVFRGSQEGIDWVDNTHPGGVGVGQYNAALRLGIDIWIKEQGTKPDVVGHSLGGSLAQLTAADFSQSIGETVTFNAPGIGVDRLIRFKGGKVTHYISPTDIVSRAGIAFLPGTIYEMRFKAGLKEQHTNIFLSDPNVVCLDVTQRQISDRTLDWQISRIGPELLRQNIGNIFFRDYHLGNDVFNLSAYYGSKALNGIQQGIKNGTEVVGSFINESILALQKKAQDAKRTVDEALKRVNEVRRIAQEKVQEAKVAYQAFKQETQKRITEVIQFSQQKAQQIALETAQAIKKAAPKVAQAVTKLVKGAVTIVSNIINAGKQIVTNVIDTGKKVIASVINTGKQVVNTVTNFVKDTYNTGVKVVSETAKNVQNAVSNTINTVASSFNKFKSVFGF